jgi:PAS domain S-box-containing protein
MRGGSFGRLPEGVEAAALAAFADNAEIAGIGLVVTRGADPPDVLYVNRTAALLFGYDVDEFLGVSLFSHFDGDPTILRERHRLQTQGVALEQRFEVPIRRKNGSKAQLEVTTSAFEHAGDPLRVTLLHDVSDRRRAILALAESEARFRTVVESAPDGVVILRGKACVYANPAAATMLGYAHARDVIGRDVTSLIHPSDAGKATVRIEELLRTQAPLAAPTEYRSRTLDGREISVEISSIPIEYQGGPAVLAFARDITERKAIHEKMVQADRLAAVGTLAAGIAHEINNPLAYVLLGMQYIERELPKLLAQPARLDDIMARLREARSGAERVGGIVKELKMFARADEIARGPVDMRQVVEAAIKIADNEIRHRATLVRDYADAPPVDGNAARLEQVFLNLLVNAAHAVSDHDPLTSEIRVTLGTDPQGRIVAEVRDNGCGIPKDLLYRVFDPFFTTKPVGVGTGLGLPICRSIVEAFGGQVELESDPGVGTTVRVVLPRYLRTTLPLETIAERRSSHPPMHRTSILVVDDEPLVGSLLCRMLEGDHDVSVASSGAEALRHLEDRTFDAVVCDVMMPGMTGMDLYGAIRERDPSLANRVIFMTGGAFVPRVADFLASVDNLTIEKPFRFDHLKSALRQLGSSAAGDADETPVDGGARTWGGRRP